MTAARTGTSGAAWLLADLVFGDLVDQAERIDVYAFPNPLYTRYLEQKAPTVDAILAPMGERHWLLVRLTVEGDRQIWTGVLRAGVAPRRQRGRVTDRRYSHGKAWWLLREARAEVEAAASGGQL